MGFQALFSDAQLSQGIALLFLFLFVIWTVYTLVSAYHWLRYGHRSAVAIPALITHVAVSFLLASYAVSGLVG